MNYAWVYGHDLTGHGWSLREIEGLVLDERLEPGLGDELLRGWCDGVAARKRSIAEWKAAHGITD